MPKKSGKKTSLFLGGGVIFLLLLVWIVSSFFSPKDAEGFIADETQLETAVSQALLESNEGGYLSGECMGEGHEILGYEKKGEDLFVYALTMYGEYGFENDHFVKVSGFGVIPAVVRLDLSYRFQEIIYPQDGADYTDSLKSMFPSRYYTKVFWVNDAVEEDLKSQERKYAQIYLDEIGRKASIGDYGDYEHILLTDVGVPVEVSNQLLERQELGAYPFWIGVSEQLEDGQRFVYELNYDTEKKQIFYTKYRYEDHLIIEQFVFDGLTGALLEEIS